MLTLIFPPLISKPFGFVGIILEACDQIFERHSPPDVTSEAYDNLHYPLAGLQTL